MQALTQVLTEPGLLTLNALFSLPFYGMSPCGPHYNRSMALEPYLQSWGSKEVWFYSLNQRLLELTGYPNHEGRAGDGRNMGKKKVRCGPPGTMCNDNFTGWIRPCALPVKYLRSLISSGQASSLASEIVCEKGRKLSILYSNLKNRHACPTSTTSRLKSWPVTMTTQAHYMRSDSKWWSVCIFFTSTP